MNVVNRQVTVDRRVRFDFYIQATMIDSPQSLRSLYHFTISNGVTVEPHPHGRQLSLAAPCRKAS